MKVCSKFLALGLALAAVVPFASATSIPLGTTISVGGVGTFAGSTFTPTVGTLTGTVTPPGSTITYTIYNDPTASGTSLGTLVFVGSSGGVTYTFDSTSVMLSTLSIFPFSQGSILSGFITTDQVGAILQPATLDLVSSVTSSSTFDFSGNLTVSATPEPSSLALLGTGLIGAAGLLLRQRRSTNS